MIRSRSAMWMGLALILGTTVAPAQAGDFDEVFSGQGERIVEGSSDDDSFHFIRDGKTIGPFGRDRWDEFIREALRNGLVRAEIGVDAQRFTFRKSDGGLVLGNATFRLPPGFGENMQFVAEHGRRSQGLGRVLIVHEPHGDTRAQHRMIDGLHALITANPEQKFVFLVEGEFDATTQMIDPQPLLKILSAEPYERRVQVNHLLDRYLIDGPLAYRLLYGREIPAFAIDDPVALKQSRPRILDELVRKRTSKSRLDEYARSLPPEQFGRFLNATREIGDLWPSLEGYHGTTQAWSPATAANLSAKFQSIETSARDLANDLQISDAVAHRDDIAMLRALEIEAEVYRLALTRDVAMARGIVDYSARYPGATLVAFIGSFHTRGIIGRLPDALAFAVVEPRTDRAIDPEDFARYERALARDAYLPETLRDAGKLHKIAVAPTSAELPTLSRVAAGAVRQCYDRLAVATTTPGINADLARSVAGFCLVNDPFRKAQLQAGGGGKRGPPPGCEAAFASFEYNPDGVIRQVTLHDKIEDRKVANGDGGSGRRPRNEAFEIGGRVPWSHMADVAGGDHLPFRWDIRVYGSGDARTVLLDDLQGGSRYLFAAQSEDDLVRLLKFRANFSIHNHFSQRVPHPPKRENDHG